MNDVDGVGSKRALSGPSAPSSVKRAKSEHDEKLVYRTPPPLPLSAPQGVERIPLRVNHLSSRYLDQLAGDRTQVLREQGRRVVGLPVVLSDGIVLNWVRHRAISADVAKANTVDDVSFVVRRHDTSVAKHENNVLRSLASIPSGSGTSAADAIIVDSDEDTKTLPLVRADVPRELHISGGTPKQDPINSRDANIGSESLSSVHSENQIKEYSDSSYLTSFLARELSSGNLSDITTSVPPPRRALTKEKGQVGLSSLLSDGDDAMFSHSEVEEFGGTENTDDCRTPTQCTNPPSLQPIRKLVATGKQRGDPRREAPLESTTAAPKGSQNQGRDEFLEEAHAITSSDDDDELARQPSDPQLKRVPLPRTDHGRARRLLMPNSTELPLVAVTMRGDCHFIERRKKFRISRYSLPNPGVFRHVADICMVGNTAVLGCDRGNHQVSILSVAGKPQMTDVAWSPHSNGPRYQDTEKRGVSRLAAVHAEGGHIKFLSGGYDGTIHEWTAAVENLSEPRSRKVVSHGASIIALAYRDRDRSVVASAQRRLHITDLSRCKTMTHPFSNEIQQIHIHPQAANLTLLEVRHLDRQIQLYDGRKGNFDGEPCLSFGRRNASGGFSSGHTRGSVHLVHFAKATEDGCVLLWDFRNGKRAVVERCFQQAEKVVHTIFADRDIATFGQGVVTFFEDYLAR